MVFNEQLARNALKRIKESPQDWRQGTWRCATGMCFAGFVAFEAGAQWADPNDTDDVDVITPDGREMDAEGFASEALGIEVDPDRIDMDPLFFPTNDVTRLEQLIDEYSK